MIETEFDDDDDDRLFGGMTEGTAPGGGVVLPEVGIGIEFNEREMRNRAFRAHFAPNSSEMFPNCEGDGVDEEVVLVDEDKPTEAVLVDQDPTSSLD